MVGGIDFWWGVNKNLVVGEGGGFPGGGISKFLTGRGDSPHLPSRESPDLRCHNFYLVILLTIFPRLILI